MSENEIVIYATFWCGDCRRVRRYLDFHKVAYCWIDIDQNEDAAAFVKQVNRGNRSVPTIVFPDGSILVEPSNLALKEKLALGQPST
jgi:mycoredoxin